MMNKYPALHKISEYLSSSLTKDTYIYVPSVWEDLHSTPSYRRVRGKKHMSRVISSIISHADNHTDYRTSLSLSRKDSKSWTERAVVYNAFPRLTSALPQGGKTSSEVSTGTFLRMIAMLPYIKALGADTLYMLPVNKIGTDSRTGDSGSPYATENLYAFDENLADPLLGEDISIEEQFAALVQAAHILGIRVVLEYAMRTASPDCDEVARHPEWFYWIHKEDLEKYCSPEFSPQELCEIKRIPQGEGKHIAPSQDYREQFVPAPSPSEISKCHDKYIASTSRGEFVIPGAFADWPPDDVQPAWKDVTYLRMYDRPASSSHPEGYNYIAYNTIRYYDPALARSCYAVNSLWDYLSDVIPHYQKNYGIDGAMIDMGHAVPRPLIKRIISKARECDPAFAFFEENFYPTPASHKAGYDISLGFGWECPPYGMERILEYCRHKDAMTMFGTQETHNTPRAVMRYGAVFSRMGYAMMAFLPHLVPFIHSGFELTEKKPVNTGVGFSAEESMYYRSMPLSLFNKGMYHWDTENNITDFISRINTLRRENISLVTSVKEASYDRPHIESDGNMVAAYRRINPSHPTEQIIVAANTDMYHRHKFYMHVPYAGDRKATDVVSGMIHTFMADWLSYDMAAGEVLVLKLER